MAFPLQLLYCRYSSILPVNPVVAEDGCLYDRDKIMKYFETNSTSPVTGNVIGKHLTRVPFVTGCIEAFIAPELNTPDEFKMSKKMRKKIDDLGQANIKKALLVHVKECKNGKCFTCHKLRRRIEIARYRHTKTQSKQEGMQEVKQEGMQEVKQEVKQDVKQE